MSSILGAPLTAPKLPRPMILDQRWENLTFVHWPVDPASVAHMFPRGTRPDVFADGVTYVALVPFEMHDISLGHTPAVPYLGSFAETNIRCTPSTTRVATASSSARWRPAGSRWYR